MRLSFSLIALLAASPALAEDFTLRADVVSGTIYGNGAALTRAAQTDMPAGRHRLFLAVPEIDQVFEPQVEVAGATIMGRPLQIRGLPIEDGALDLADQANARAVVTAAEAALEAAQSELALSQREIRAAEIQLAYLEAVATGGEDGVALPEGAEALTAFLDMLGQETIRAATELAEAREAQQELLDTVSELQDDLAIAEGELLRLRPYGVTVDAVMIEVEVTEPAEVTAVLDHLSAGVAWRPSYRLDLSSETGALDISRMITLDLQTTERWIDVDLSFSTANPDRRRSPQQLSPDPVLIRPPEAQGSLLAEADSAAELRIATPPPAVAALVAQPMIEGLSLTYEYQQPVTVNGTTELALDALSFETELTRLAVPRLDRTAFLMAEFENTSGEPLIPGEARFFRDGALIGEGGIGPIAAGETTEIAFGPVDHLLLEWQDLARDTGDRGVFIQSRTEDRRVRFSVENTSDAEETVRLVYATPFAEQEDLDLDLTLQPAPSERDIDGQRGVHAWELTLAPGARQDITMTLSLDWPEDYVLDWQP